jgi:hypothetical protein
MNFIKCFLLLFVISKSYSQSKQYDSLDKSWKFGIFTGYGFETGLIKNKDYFYEPLILIIEFQKAKFYIKTIYL